METQARGMGLEPKKSSGSFPQTFRPVTLEPHLNLKKVEIFLFTYFLPYVLQVISTGSFIISKKYAENV